MNVLYTNHCPLCNALKEQLDAKKIEYVEETDLETMLNLGITRTPMMHIDGYFQLLNYKDSLKWVEETR